MPGTLSKVAQGAGQVGKDILLRILLAITVIVVCALAAIAGLLHFAANLVN